MQRMHLLTRQALVIAQAERLAAFQATQARRAEATQRAALSGTSERLATQPTARQTGKRRLAVARRTSRMCELLARLGRTRVRLAPFRSLRQPMRAPTRPRGAMRHAVLPRSRRHRQARARPLDCRDSELPKRAVWLVRAVCRLADADAPPHLAARAPQRGRADCEGRRSWSEGEGEPRISKG